MTDDELYWDMRGQRNRLSALNAELVEVLELALNIMTIDMKVRSPQWNGEATVDSAIGMARAAITKAKTK